MDGIMALIVPYGSKRKAGKFPISTSALIAANICLYIVLLPIDRPMLAGSMGFFPADLSVRQIMSSMFVRGSIPHLVWNMLFLWLFGPNGEDALGHIEFLLMYIGSGFAAALLQTAIIQSLVPAAGMIPVIGASGAIAGILGVFAVRFYKTDIDFYYLLGLKTGTIGIPAMWILGIWFVEQLAGGILDIAKQGTGGAAYWSHIGGMLFGMALAYGINMGHEGSMEYIQEDIKNGASSKAAARLEKEVESNPSNAGAMMKLGEIFAANNDDSKALDYYRSAILTYLKSNDRQRAAAARAEMNHYYPDAMLDPSSDYQIARYLLETNCHEAALKMMDAISVSHPSSPEAEISTMIAGDICYHSFNDLLNARRYYELFKNRYPNSNLWAMVSRSLNEVNDKLQASGSHGSAS
jgi:membrane associated rhomboid family serine protease